MPTKADLDKLIAAINDLTRQVRNLVVVTSSVLERYVRSMDELDSLRLAQEEQREHLRDHFQENTRWSDKLDKSLRELQRYIIMVKMTGGGNQETREVEAKFSRQQIEDTLAEELVNQQDLIIQYQKNSNHVAGQIAKYGETVPLMNELAEYQNKIKKAQESMTRIREQLE